MKRSCSKHSDATFSPSGKCRPCNREYQARWLSKNREVQNRRIRAVNDRMREANKERYWDYLLAHPCVDCGTNDPPVLEADHVADKKRANLSRLLGNASWAAVLAELAKCEMRCANCHRIKTAERSISWRHVRYSAVSPHAYNVSKG